MRAAILHHVNEPLTIEAIELDAPRAHEVLIRTAAAGICHSDLHFIDGLHSTRLPVIPATTSSQAIM